MRHSRIAVVGGGLAGLVAADRLLAAGFPVTVFEKWPEAGGLVGVVDTGQDPLERYYHHLFTTDVDYVDLAREFGLDGEIEWLPSKMGIYSEERLWDFGTPASLLKFSPLGLAGRVQLALSTLKLRQRRDWREIEGETAAGWLKKNGFGKVYDVVFPEEWAAEVLIKAGKLQPLDTDLLPNLANVTDPTFRNPPYDPGTGGKKYTTVYMFGTEGFAVRIDKVPDPPESWAPLFEEKYRQQVSLLDGAREVLGPALFMLGSNLNCTDQAMLDKATQKAMAQRPLVTVYDSNTQVNRIQAGLPLVECWDGDAVQAMDRIGVSKVRYILPREGYMVWADAPSIPASAPSPYGAHLFLDFLMDPKVAALCASHIGYEPVIEAADPLITSMVQRAMRATPEQIAGGTLPRDLGDFTDSYTKAYAKVRAS